MQMAVDDSAVQFNGQPILLSPEMLPDAAALPVTQPVAGEAERLDELALLEIIEQQLAEIEARDAAQGDTLPVVLQPLHAAEVAEIGERAGWPSNPLPPLSGRSEEHTSELQSRENLV